jgi:hypothetical protein
MSENSLTYEIASKYLKYDPGTGIVIWIKKRGSKAEVGQEAGKLRYDGYRHLGLLGKYYTTHRIAWLLYYKTWPQYTINHKNRIRDDNRIENLEDVTSRGQTLHYIKDEGFLGNNVSWNSRDRKWRCQAWIQGRNVHLGYFDDKSAADTVGYKVQEILADDPEQLLTAQEVRLMILREVPEAALQAKLYQRL